MLSALPPVSEPSMYTETILKISLYIKKAQGPSTDPCDTPLVKGTIYKNSMISIGKAVSEPLVGVRRGFLKYA